MTKEEILTAIVELWSPDFKAALENLIEEYRFDAFLRRGIELSAQEAEVACAGWENAPGLSEESKQQLFERIRKQIESESETPC